MAHSLEHMIPSWWQYLRRWRSCGLVERGVPPRVLQHWKRMYNIAQLPVYSLFSIPTVKGGDNSVSCFWYHPHHLLLYLFPVVKGANPLEQQDKRNKLFSKLPCHDILLTGRGKVTNTEVGNREQSDALKRLIMMMWGFVCFFLFFLNFHYM